MSLIISLENRLRDTKAKLEDCNHKYRLALLVAGGAYTRGVLTRHWIPMLISAFVGGMIGAAICLLVR